MQQSTSAIRTSCAALAIGIAAYASGGCYNSLRTDVPDAAGALDDGGTGDGGTALSITSPSSPAYTNGSVAIEVSVGIAATSDVQLLKNGMVLAVFAGPPYAFTWDTTTEPEGSYQIFAQTVVGGQIVMSPPVTIVVDRTPPTIVSSVPAAGATNVSLTDPISVVFSEALAPATVSGAVRLAVGSAAVDATSSLASDGKTIDVTVTDRSSLVLPGAMSETVASSITDLAGNSFAGTTWSVSVPLWVDLGTVNGGYPQMVLGSDGEPILITANGPLLMFHYSGGRIWEPIPSPSVMGQFSGTFGAASGPGGDVFVVWTESSVLELGRWNGSSWDRNWPSPVNAAIGSPQPAVAVTEDDRPIVSSIAPVASGGYQENVVSWTGSVWKAYAPAPMAFNICQSVPCRLLIDKSGFPCIELAEQLFRWMGTGWTAAAGSSLSGLVINSSNQVLSIQDNGTSLQVVAISENGSLSNYVPLLTADVDVISSDDTPQLALDTLSQPVIVWAKSRIIHVARWTGNTWDSSYGSLTPAQGKTAFVLVGGSIPVVAWEDNTTASLSTHVAKSNH